MSRSTSPEARRNPCVRLSRRSPFISETEEFMRTVRLVRVSLLAILASACGGGGTGTGPTVVGNNTPTPAPPTPAPAAMGKPTLGTFNVSSRAGRAPLTVAFGLCNTRDGNVGQALTYLASFEGENLTPQGGCGFSHNYATTGVSVFDTQVCARDSQGQQTCETVTIKTY